MKILFLALILLWPYWPLRAEAPAVVINEIAWMGTAASAYDEWLELFNNSESEIDLTGWKLVAADGEPSIVLAGKIGPHGFFLLERTDDETIKDMPANQIYSGSLSNSGENLELRNAADEIADAVLFSAGWPAGDAAGKISMERKDPAQPGTAENWAANNGLAVNGQNVAGGTIKGTPGAINSAVEITVEPAPAPENNPPVPPVATTTAPAPINQAPIAIATTSLLYNIGDLVINELVSDPGDGEEEWVEIFNVAGVDVDLAGWTIEEGSGAKTALSGRLSAVSRFAAFGKFKGNLNNSGDIVILRDPKGRIIDQVVYGDWPDGDLKNNAPAAGNPKAIARPIDGRNSLNNKDDFRITAKPTRAASNIIINDVAREKDSQGNPEKYELSADIFITEIFPNPIGNDAAGEFIEIYNGGDHDVSLAGWKICVGDCASSKSLATAASSTSIKARSFLILERKTSRLVLENGAGAVKLFRPLEEVAWQTVKYEAAIEGYSYAAVWPVGAVSRWEWSGTPTSGRENAILKYNHEPEIGWSLADKFYASESAVFDASDSADEDGDPLSFHWLFGDGAESGEEETEHVYAAPGKYQLALYLSDGRQTVKKEKIINVRKNPDTDKDEPAAVSAKSSAAKSKTAKKIKTSGKKTAASRLIVQGEVLVEPGVFGVQYFYIAGNREEGTAPIQIYNYKKEFPGLQCGDVVAVSGEESLVGEEIRIKTAKAADIRIVGKSEKKRIEEIGCGQANEEYAGRLVRLAGEVTGKKGQAVYIDDGDSEAVIYIKKKTGIKPADFNIGDNIKAVGLLMKYRDEYQLLPRSIKDIEKISRPGEVLGEVEQNRQWSVPTSETNASLKILKYVVAALAAAVLVLAGWIAKLRFRG